MDEMPSGVLNGFTPNEAKKIKIEENKNRYEREKNIFQIIMMNCQMKK